MKKKFKIAAGVVILIAALGAGAFYLTRPVEVEIFSVTKQTLTESLSLKASVAAGEMEVVTATTNGIITEINCREGDTVKAGEELVLVDDSEYQQDIADELAGLKKQKDEMYTQNYMSGLEVRMQQEQLIEVMDAARHEYDMMFGENGTAYNDVDAANWAYKTAQASLEAAIKANDDWEDAKKQYPTLYAGSTAPFSGPSLAAYETAISEADVARKNAELFSSEKNRLYYEGLITAYQARFNTLTELGDYNAKSAGQEASRLQLSMDALIRKQSPDIMAAEEGGIVSELLSEEGSYVTQYQPLLRIYHMDDKKLEAWMLTEDACNYKAGDVVSAELPDGTVVEETITFISPTAEERVSTLGVNENRCRVELTADNLPEQMGPGYEVTLQFARELSEVVLTLPVSALVNEDQENFVYVVEDGKCRKVRVTVGIYSGGMVEITEGLAPGAVVVQNPGEYELRDGMTVKVR